MPIRVSQLVDHPRLAARLRRHRVQSLVLQPLLRAQHRPRVRLVDPRRLPDQDLARPRPPAERLPRLHQEDNPLNLRRLRLL